jgi:uncharacterized OB-fold protein
MKECVRCGGVEDLVAVEFKVDGEVATWEESYVYCRGCIKELGW